MEHIIDSITLDKTPCYFISPHLDDAMLSAGGLLSVLNKKTTVKVVSIFTEGADKPYTKAAKGYLRYCGYENARDLFKRREEEDRKACEIAGVTPVHLGFVDGTFRKRKTKLPFIQILGKYIPELISLYPLGFKTLLLARQDTELIQEVAQKLRLTITEKNYVVFCPLGTVKHMDHEITTKACLEMFNRKNSEATTKKLIFWTDYPYIKNVIKDSSFIKKHNFKSFVWDENLELKRKFIAEYKTQLPSLFPDGNIPLIPETFYFKTQ